MDSDMDLEYFDPESPVHSARQMDVMVSRVLNIIDPGMSDRVHLKVVAIPSVSSFRLIVIHSV